MKKLLFSSLALALVALVAFAPKNTESILGASTYKVDTQSGKLSWLGKKFTGEHTGNLSLGGGSLEVADKKLTAGRFEIDLRTLTVTDIKDAESNAKLVGHLKADDFFGVEKFPKSNFVITSVTSKGGDNYDLKGKLTIKDVTEEISFPAVVKIEKEKLSATAKITINRTKFGIKYGSKSFFDNLGDKFIYDDFTLDVNLVAYANGAKKTN